MSITGVGSKFSYLYNANTKKLETTEQGVEDSFVKWFNGEIGDDELPDEMNGFDKKKKVDIQKLFEFFGTGAGGGKVLEDPDGDNIYELSGDIANIVKSTYSVNGKEAFTAHTPMQYTASEIKIFTTIKQPFTTKVSKPYNPSDNSISIAVGDKFTLGNGFSFTVSEDGIYVQEPERARPEDVEHANRLCGGLVSLMHFADQQWFSSMIHEEDTPVLLEFLNQLGIDTTREFIVNGTKSEVRYGRIAEVGNNYVVPSSIYNKALKRYEENMYIPLNERYAKK